VMLLGPVDSQKDHRYPPASPIDEVSLEELSDNLIWKEKSRGELRVARDAAGVRLGFRRRWSA